MPPRVSDLAEPNSSVVSPLSLLRSAVTWSMVARCFSVMVDALKAGSNQEAWRPNATEDPALSVAIGH